MALKFIKTARSIIMNLMGRTVSVSESHPMFDQISVELSLGSNADVVALEEMSDIENAIIIKTGGKVSVAKDVIFYDGKPVGNDLSRRILKMLSEGYDIEPWVLFMDNVMLNPSEDAREELHLFLESGNMPITPDGHFLAFKWVNRNMTSLYDNTTLHEIGKPTSMPREQVNPDRHNTCSYGLHFCSQGYLPVYSNNQDSIVLVLKINPADVVAIPSDYSNTKGRAWTYITLGVLKDSSEASFAQFMKPVLGEVCGVDTFEDTSEDTEVDTSEDMEVVDTIDDDEGVVEELVLKVKKTAEKRALYNGLKKKEFLKAIKRAGGARPYARENDLPKSTVQDWVKKARA